MFKFATEQKVFDIGGVKIGGQPGQLPTVLVGSMFYRGHKIVKDAKTGDFDVEAARRLLKENQAHSERTGNPCVIDVVGDTPEVIPKYIEFIAEATDAPFLIDGTIDEVRLAGLECAAKLGVLDRAIYNSIMPGIKDDEIAAIRKAGLKSSILLTFNPMNPTLLGRLEVIDEILEAAERAGVENCLIDATVLDIPDPATVAKVIHMVKEKYGLPGGCGAHNSIDRWHSSVPLSDLTYKTTSVVANTFPIAMGADFLLHGPIENSGEVYTPVAVADAYIAYAARQEFGTAPLVDNHPLKKVFKNPEL